MLILLTGFMINHYRYMPYKDFTKYENLENNIQLYLYKFEIAQLISMLICDNYQDDEDNVMIVYSTIYFGSLFWIVCNFRSLFKQLK